MRPQTLNRLELSIYLKTSSRGLTLSIYLAPGEGLSKLAVLAPGEGLSKLTVLAPARV